MDTFQAWLQILEKKGMKPEDAVEVIDGSAKLAGTALYGLVTASLTEEDLKTLEKIVDDSEAEAKLNELFHQRSGMSIAEAARRTVEEFLQKNTQSIGSSRSAE